VGTVAAAFGDDNGEGAAGVAAEHGASRGARFALAKFRPTTLPDTLVTRPALHDRLSAGAGQRLTVVVGSAGAGKSVLLSSWAAARPPGVTSWLSCDRADANPVRFWAGFIEAPRMVAPWFGADAADMLAMDNAMSADVTASIANDAAKLPAGSAVIVDDFHTAAAAAAGDMTDLVERWPAGTAQLVLASRIDPPLRLHRMRMTGDLCELRDRDLRFSLAESRDLLAGFGVQVGDGELSLLHRRSEGWAAAVQMAALSLRGTADPARIARALEVRGHAIAEFFVAEVLERQLPEVAQFMLDTCILGELTADSCAAVTGRPDAAALLRAIGTASLFLVALDDEQTSFRYHHLVRRLLRAELHARDPAREQALQLRAAEWFQAAGDTRRAARHFLAARQADRALALLEDRVLPDFLADPAMPAPLDLSMIDASVLTDAPDRLLTVAADLLLSGDTGRGGQYLDLLERVQPPIPRESRLRARLLAFQSFRHVLTGQTDQAISAALTARSINEQMQLTDEWNVAAPMILPTAYTWLEDFPAVEREAAAALATPELTEPVKLVMVPGMRALAWFEAGRLNRAADAAGAAEAQARRLGFDRHFFAVDFLRTLAGLALERRDLDTAEQLTEQALSITERRRPMFEFLALLDRAQIWAARGQVREALATIEVARQILAGTGSVLLMRADELEALLRLSLGDRRTPAELASRLPPARRGLLHARIALASGDHRAAAGHLRSPSLGDLTPRRALVRQLLLAAAAIERGDRAAAGIVAGAVQTARQEGYLNTVVSTAPQVTSYLIEHAAPAQRGPFLEQLIGAGLQARAAQPDASRSRGQLAEPLTPAELRVLTLLPTSTYLQMAEVLYVSRNTVKTHLRSIYQKLGVESRSQAIERAVEVRLL
jgi:LuxR family transcriptional regulator, maltose regulon positive regulatory protein